MKTLKSRDITRIVKNLLGDSVEYAYTVITKYDMKELGGIEDKVDISSISIEPSDSSPVVIKMKDRKPVILWTSEWGGLLQFESEDKIPLYG